jgi:hypothetical protein
MIMIPIVMATVVVAGTVDLIMRVTGTAMMTGLLVPTIMAKVSRHW